jgi:hypothetical protein
VVSDGAALGKEELAAPIPRNNHKNSFTSALSRCRPFSEIAWASLISIKLRARRGWARIVLSGAFGFSPYASSSLFGYFFSMITVLTAAVVLLTGLSNISTLGSGRHNPRPAIARAITVEAQRHSPVVKEAVLAKDVSPVVATAKADTKKIKHYKPKVLARQHNNNYGNGNALGYAEESRYGPSGLFFR